MVSLHAGSETRLLLRHLGSDLREHVVCVSANQADSADDDHEDYRQHHGVLGNVLTRFLSPQPVNCFHNFHDSPPGRQYS